MRAKVGMASAARRPGVALPARTCSADCSLGACHVGSPMPCSRPACEVGPRRWSGGALHLATATTNATSAGQGRCTQGSNPAFVAIRADGPKAARVSADCCKRYRASDTCGATQGWPLSCRRGATVWMGNLRRNRVSSGVIPCDPCRGDVISPVALAM